ncbi:hypothetical protein ISS98_04485 [Dyella flagellata]
MNRIYRLVWNRAFGVMQVASEFAIAPHGGVCASADDRVPGLAVRPLARALVGMLAPMLLLASPAAFAAVAPQQYNVTQATDDGTGNTVGSLSWAIIQSNAAPGSIIDITLASGNSITVSGNLPAISAATTLESASNVSINAAITGTAPATLLVVGVNNATVAVTGIDGDYGSAALTSGGAGSPGHAGGVAIGGSGFVLNNQSKVSGGVGGAGGYGSRGGTYGTPGGAFFRNAMPGNGANGGAGGTGASGGAGVSGSALRVANTGIVVGGLGGAGGRGGAGSGGGKYVGSPFSSSSAAVGIGGTAGLGGAGANGGNGGNGGAGINTTGVSTLVNTSAIKGGMGGYAGAGGRGGNGGQILAPLRGGIVSGNSGNTGEAGGTGGSGGAGVTGASFNLQNSGLIEGGYGRQGGHGGEGGSGSGFYSPITSGNAGSGGAGGAAGAGGVGGNAVEGSQFTFSNTGTASGGNGGGGGYGGSGGYGGRVGAVNDVTGKGANAGAGAIGGAGGAAVSGNYFTATNDGSLTGGVGGYGGHGGSGGSGGWSTSSLGGIAGNGGSGGNGAAGGHGGAGVIGIGFTFTNNKNVSGGTGGVAGIAGLKGFAGDTVGSTVGENGNDGGSGIGGAGGDGVAGSQFIFANNGTDTGGAGGRGNHGPTGAWGGSYGDVGSIGGVGGAAVNGISATIVNTGTLDGGAGGTGGAGLAGFRAGSAPSVVVGGTGGMGSQGGTGGAGVTGTGFTVTSSQHINGGTGGNGGLGGSGGWGGYGLGGPGGRSGTGGAGGVGGGGGIGVSGAGFTLTNSGAITGGTGGVGGTGGGAYSSTGTAGNGGNGGAGGTGLNGSDFTLINTGTIAGGTGGSAGESGLTVFGSTAGTIGVEGAGGVGVVSNGGSTITTAGSIAGGVSTSGAQADAMDLSGGGNSLVLEAGYAFTGNVVSQSGNTNGGDTVTLGGSSNATFNLGSLGAVGSNAPLQGFAPHLSKSGTSTWTLTGTGNAIQTWTITNGSLVGDSTSIVGNVTFAPISGGSASLTFDQATNATYNGVISGNGSLTKSGAGTLTLTGNNTYTGATTVNGGMLQVANNNTSGMVTGNVTNNGTMAFARTDAVTYNAVISGSGSVAQIGSGTLILDGVNTYAGGTTVQAGTLEVGDSAHSNASIQNNVTVNTNGTLRGHGSINGNVTSDGTVWPGGSVGVLTINGNYTQNADATLQIDVTPTQASELLVNGNANLAGTLHLIYAPGAYSTNGYTLVQANSLSGKFTATTSTGVPSNLDTQVVYTPTQANLLMMQKIVAPADGGLYANLLQSVNLVGQQSLDTVLGATLRSGDTSCNGHAAHTKTVASSCNSDLWVQYSGGNQSLTGLNSSLFGLQGGFDHALNDVLHLGVEAGFSRINSSDYQGSNANVDSVHGGVYAYANVGPVVLSGTIDETHSSYSVYRQTGIGRSVARPDGDATAAALQAAWPLSAAKWQVTPAIGALYQHQSLSRFNESLASTNPFANDFVLQAAHSTYNTLQPYARVQFSRPFVAQGINYVPQFDVGYRYNAHSGNATVQATSQDGTTFVMPGEPLGRGMATVGARITAQAGASWSLYLDYSGQFASHLNDNALSMGFIKQF